MATEVKSTVEPPKSKTNGLNLIDFLEKVLETMMAKIVKGWEMDILPKIKHPGKIPNDFSEIVETPTLWDKICKDRNPTNRKINIGKVLELLACCLHLPLLHHLLHLSFSHDRYLNNYTIFPYHQLSN